MRDFEAGDADTRVAETGDIEAQNEDVRDATDGVRNSHFAHLQLHAMATSFLFSVGEG